MGRPDPHFLVVGHLSKAHGTKGEIYVTPLTDHPEVTFLPGVVLHLGGHETDGPDPDMPSLCIEACRPFRQGFLVRFGGMNGRDQADKLRGYYLFREAKDLEPLAEGEYFYHQLLGMEVVTVDGERLGEITEVYESSPADLLQVEGAERQLVIPFLPHIVVEVDASSSQMVIDPPEGLLDL